MPVQDNMVSPARCRAPETRNELVRFWDRCDLAAPPYWHPDDHLVLRRGNGRHIDDEPKTFDQYLVSPLFGDFEDHRLQLSLLPAPYLGNLANADIIVLLLNPGLAFCDYYAEARVPRFRQRLEMNLRQSFERIDFPFHFLDPEFCWHGGFLWWERKLRSVITTIADRKFNKSYLRALRDLSGRLACIELVPYHSQTFRSHALINHLPSARAARQFVHDVLVPAANNDERTIIVTRQVAAWRLPEGTLNPVVYRGGLTRGASLGLSTPGGQEILRRYGIV